MDGHVTITVKDYDKLKETSRQFAEFKQKLQDKKNVHVIMRLGYFGEEFVIFSKDELFKHLKEDVDILNDRINSFKNMTVKEFKKFKKQNQKEQKTKC